MVENERNQIKMSLTEIEYALIRTNRKQNLSLLLLFGGRIFSKMTSEVKKWKTS